MVTSSIQHYISELVNTSFIARALNIYIQKTLGTGRQTEMLSREGVEKFDRVDCKPFTANSTAMHSRQLVHTEAYSG